MNYVYAALKLLLSGLWGLICGTFIPEFSVCILAAAFGGYTIPILIDKLME